MSHSLSPYTWQFSRFHIYILYRLILLTLLSQEYSFQYFLAEWGSKSLNQDQSKENVFWNVDLFNRHLQNFCMDQNIKIMYLLKIRYTWIFKFMGEELTMFQICSSSLRVDGSVYYSVTKRYTIAPLQT